MNNACADFQNPQLGNIVDDHIWTGSRWQALHGRNMNDCFFVKDGFFWPLDAKHEEIDVEDIARGLSHESRFGNQTPYFYSVAWHSVALVHTVPDHLKQWALIHDAAEAYLSDIPRVLKHTDVFKPYRDAESKLLITIAESLGMEDPNEPEELLYYDVRMGATELIELFGDLGVSLVRAINSTEEYIEEARSYTYLVKEVNPQDAYNAWMSLYDELFK